MSTDNAACEVKVNPPGVAANITSQGIMSMPNGNGQVQISFAGARPDKPLPPSVQAEYCQNDFQIKVSAVVFVAVNPNNLNFSVNWDENYLQPHCYITYDASEISSQTFYGYQINFTLPINSKVGIPAKINTVVWDKDPITSRGTETSVQR